MEEMTIFERLVQIKLEYFGEVSKRKDWHLIMPVFDQLMEKENWTLTEITNYLEIEPTSIRRAYLKHGTLDWVLKQLEKSSKERRDTL